MVVLSIPRLDVLGSSSPLTRDIGPGPSSHTVGTQGKIGPHTHTHTYIYIYMDIHVKLLTIKITKNCLPKIGEAIILVYEEDRETKRTETQNTVQT